MIPNALNETKIEEIKSVNDHEPAKFFEESNSQLDKSNSKVCESEQISKSKNKNKRQSSKKGKP